MNAYADPAIQQWNLQTLASIEEAQAWVAQWQKRWQAETDGCWAVTDGDTDEVLGRLALRDISLPGGRAQCTYRVLPAARGRGIAGSGARATPSRTNRGAVDDNPSGGPHGVHGRLPRWTRWSATKPTSGFLRPALHLAAGYPSGGGGRLGRNDPRQRRP
jgi:hypothetical protein